MSNYISPNDLRQVHDDFTFPAEVHTVIERAAGTIEALQSALDRTERNLRLSIAGKPVRDLAENYAENDAARNGEKR